MKKVATALREHPIYSKHLKVSQGSPFTISPSGLLFFIDSSLDNQLRMVIPEIYEVQDGKTISYQEEIISSIHIIIGHLGWKKTWERTRQDYYWPNMLNDIKEYVATCDACQRNKSSTQRPAGLLHALPAPCMSGTHLSMDFIGPLPICYHNGQHYNSIMTITDRFSGWVWAIPTDIELTAEEAATLFFDFIYPYTSLPISIVSDRDTRFTSKFWSTLMDLLGIKLDMSSAFHPQTDGSTERANKTIVQILRNFVSTRQTDWAQHMTKVAVAINTAKNETTGMSPFYIEHGRHPRSLPDNPAITSIPAVNGLLDTLLAIQHMASKNIMDARQSQTEQANKKRRPAPTYKVGQQVLLSMENIKAKTSIRSKLQAKWSGPYTVTEYWPDTDNVRLKLPHDWQIHNVFHTSLIKPYHSNNDEKFPSRKHQRPPPVPTADIQEDNYEVESVKDNKVIRGTNYYLVKWLGWPESDNQWVKESDMEGSKELIDEYLATLQDIPVPPPRHARQKSIQLINEPTRRSQRTKKPRVHFTV
jgi:transposase InsO family protein